MYIRTLEDHAGGQGQGAHQGIHPLRVVGVVVGGVVGGVVAALGRSRLQPPKIIAGGGGRER